MRLLMVILALATLLGCATGRGCAGSAWGGPTESLIRGGTDAALDGADNEYDRIARELKDAEKITGRQRAARMVTRFGYALYGAAALVLAFAIFTSFIGGSILIAGKQAAGGFVLAGGLAIGGYFVLVYGVIASEVGCWVGMAIVTLIVGVNLHSHVRAWLDTRTAKTLLAKRAASGDDAKDAIQRLPVSVAIKRKLDDAWDKLRSFPSDSAADVIEAKSLLAKFKLPVPKGTL